MRLKAASEEICLTCHRYVAWNVIRSYWNWTLCVFETRHIMSILHDYFIYFSSSKASKEKATILSKGAHFHYLSNQAVRSRKHPYAMMRFHQVILPGHQCLPAMPLLEILLNDRVGPASHANHAGTESRVVQHVWERLPDSSKFSIEFIRTKIDPKMLAYSE
jgi:hypothetical protein